jgi:hypothetical protein
MSLEVPKVINGELQCDKNRKPNIELEYGKYTCVHIAHYEAWKCHLHDKQQDLIKQSAGYVKLQKLDSKMTKNLH